MLSDFPQLLTYGFFAPTLLRVVAAVAFAYMALVHVGRRDKLAAIPFPVVGASMQIVWFAIIVEVILALMLVFGWHTQIAALVGMIATAKCTYFHRRWPSLFFFPQSTSIALFVILASLMLSGAGAFAYDLPL